MTADKVLLTDLDIGTKFTNLDDAYEGIIVECKEGYNGKGVLVLGTSEDLEYRLLGTEYKSIKLKDK